MLPDGFPKGIDVVFQLSKTTAQFMAQFLCSPGLFLQLFDIVLHSFIRLAVCLLFFQQVGFLLEKPQFFLPLMVLLGQLFQPFLINCQHRCNPVSSKSRWSNNT